MNVNFGLLIILAQVFCCLASSHKFQNHDIISLPNYNHDLEAIRNNEPKPLSLDVKLSIGGTALNWISLLALAQLVYHSYSQDVLRVWPVEHDNPALSGSAVSAFVLELLRAFHYDSSLGQSRLFGMLLTVVHCFSAFTLWDALTIWPGVFILELAIFVYHAVIMKYT